MTWRDVSIDPGRTPTARSARPAVAGRAELLAERAPVNRLAQVEASISDADPLGLDLQLALYICYELHYRGFDTVDPGWEWNAGLLHLRGRLENTFLAEIRQPGRRDRRRTRLPWPRWTSCRSNPPTAKGCRITCAIPGNWGQMRE